MQKTGLVLVFVVGMLFAGCFGGEVVPDPPVITLLGESVVFVEIGAGYDDPGFTAVDSSALDITDAVVVGGDVVDPDNYGIYVVTYNVADGQGREAEEKQRTVWVVSHFDDFTDVEGTNEDWTYVPEGTWVAGVEDSRAVILPENTSGTARIDWELLRTLNRNNSNFAFGVRFKNALTGQIQPQQNWQANVRYDVAWNGAADSITLRSRWWDGAQSDFDIETLETVNNVGITSGWHEMVVEFIGETINIYWDDLNNPVLSITDDRHMTEIIMTVATWQQTISIDYVWLAFFDVE